MVDVVTIFRTRLTDLEKLSFRGRGFLKKCNILLHQIDELIGDVPHKARFSLEAFRIRVKSLINEVKAKSQKFIFEVTDSVFKNRINSSLYTNVLFVDASHFFDGIQAHVEKYMSDFMKVHHCIKACAVFCGRFSNKVLEENKYFNSGYEAIFQIFMLF